MAGFCQNSYTVSNVAGTSANFRTLQGAHDSVPAGSILYLMPSATSYGTATFTKKLTVYGTGFFVGANLAPNTQANAGAVIVQTITFSAGSDNSMIEGLQFTDYSWAASGGAGRINMDTVSNIIVSRCLFTPPNAQFTYYFYLNTVSNALIRQCFFSCLGRTMNGFIEVYGATGGFSGVRVENNIMDYLAIGANGTTMLAGRDNRLAADATFTNNTLLMNLYTSSFGNLNYTNNIFVNIPPGNYSYNSVANIQLGGTNLNNIINAPAILASNGNNMQSANTDSMFVGTQTGYHSTDQQWMLRAGNFANTFGAGGVACGAFGGSNPYKLSGIPSIPYIYSLTVPAQATAPGSISVHIKARATN